MLKFITEKEIAELVNEPDESISCTIAALIRAGLISPELKSYAETGASNYPISRDYYTFCGDAGIRDSLLVVAEIKREYLTDLVNLWHGEKRDYA